MRTQRIVQDNERLASILVMEGRLLHPKPDVSAIDCVLPPGGCQQNTGEVRVVAALQDTAGDIRHTLVGRMISLVK